MSTAETEDWTAMKDRDTEADPLNAWLIWAGKHDLWEQTHSPYTICPLLFEIAFDLAKLPGEKEKAVVFPAKQEEIRKGHLSYYNYSLFLFFLAVFRLID